MPGCPRSGQYFKGLVLLALLSAACRAPPIGPSIDLGGPPSPDGGVTPDMAYQAVWHWDSPSPQGNNLRAVFVVPGATAGNDQLYMAGDNGTLFHLSHGAWDHVDVGGLLGYDGSALLGLQVGPEQDILAVGVADAILTREGGQWSSQMPLFDDSGIGSLNAVWASPVPSEYYVAGSTGRIFHVIADSWMQEGQGLSTQYLAAVSGIGSGVTQEVFAGGALGTVLHRQNGTWSVEAAGLTDQQLNGALALPGGECYLVGDSGTVLHRLNSAWTVETVPTSANLNGVWGSGADLFAVGQSGTLLHRSAGTWTVEGAGLTGNLLSAVYGVVHGGQPTVYAVGNEGVLLARQDGTWSALSSAITPNPLSAVWARSSNEVYVVGPGGTVLRRHGTPAAGTWTTEAVGVASADLNAVWGYAATQATTSDADVYAVGTGGTLMHRVAGVWSIEGAILTGEEFLAVWVGADTVVATGRNDRLAIKTQGQWALDTSIPTAAGDLTAVWGSGQGSALVVYVGSASGVIYRFAQGAWTQDGVGLSQNPITAIFGQDDSQVFALGAADVALVRRGGGWSQEALNLAESTTPAVTGCAVPGTDNVYAISAFGSILLRSDASWNRDGTPLTQQLMAGISAVGPDDVYAVGPGGIVLHKY